MILPGTTYRTDKNIKVKGTIHFDKPLSLGFDFELPINEIFKISSWTEHSDNLIHVWLLNPKKHESKIIDKEILDSPYYSSYSLIISRIEIENNCSLQTDFEKAIYFYSPLDEFGDFSNFANYGFEYQNLYYPTVEHFFQSQKFIDKNYAELIRLSKNPKDAADMGKSRVFKIKENWDEIKQEIMMIGVQKKIDTHENLKKLLLSTDNNLIIENSPYDNYWGIGSNGTGLNQLGTILMRVRELKQNAL